MSNSDDLTVVYSLADMLDGQMAKGVLAEEGRPCLLQDAEGSGEILRIVGWGSPFGVNVVVTKENAERARQILTEVFGEER